MLTNPQLVLICSKIKLLKKMFLKRKKIWRKKSSNKQTRLTNFFINRLKWLKTFIKRGKAKPAIIRMEYLALDQYK